MWCMYNCTFHISSSFTILLIVIPLKVRRTWTSLTWLGRLSSKPQGFSRLCCFGTGITDLCCHAWHFTCDLQIELKILWLHVRRLATKHILRSQKILIRTFFQGFWNYKTHPDTRGVALVRPLDAFHSWGFNLWVSALTLPHGHKLGCLFLISLESGKEARLSNICDFLILPALCWLKITGEYFKLTFRNAIRSKTCLHNL